MLCLVFFFFFNDTATTEIYTLSLHDALPISMTISRTSPNGVSGRSAPRSFANPLSRALKPGGRIAAVVYSTPENNKFFSIPVRSEEHTSELQSRQYLVCRLLLEKKKKIQKTK